MRDTFLLRRYIQGYRSEVGAKKKQHHDTRTRVQSLTKQKTPDEKADKGRTVCVSMPMHTPGTTQARRWQRPAVRGWSCTASPPCHTRALQALHSPVRQP